MNIIDCTIKMRQEARANYANLSQAVADKEMKRLFSLLALAEDEYLDKLMAIKSDNMVSRAADDQLSSSVCAYKTQLKAANLGETLRNDSDAYLHVLKDEENSIAFFNRLAGSAKNETMRKVCLTVAEKEREHLQMIENIYAFVEAPQTYLEWGEFSNLKSL